MNKLLLLILLQLFGMQGAYSQAIYELVYNQKVKAYIVGSAHSNINVSESYLGLLDSVIAKSDALLIETIPGKKPDMETRRKVYASQGITLRELAQKDHHECLRNLIRDWDSKWKMPFSYLIDWGPAAFLITYVQAPFSLDSRDDRKSLDLHIYKRFDNRFPVIELEGWAGSVDALLRIEPAEHGRIAEAFCEIGTTPGFPQKKYFANMQLLADALEKGENDQFRNHFQFVQKQIGWSDKALYQNLGYRDRRNALLIHEHLQSGKYKAPLIAVGIVHLGGADGLLNNLRASGYVIKQYQPSAK